jgi:NAD(P)-dependent dehydrogenase (short-subunit alcohol dehydrogenase family)
LVELKQEDGTMQVKDRVFIVTGASSGIGLATAIALSERGAKVALFARSTNVLKKLAQQLPGSLPVTVDMTQFDRVREAVGAVHQNYGRIDGLVNNAGRSYAASVEEVDPALFDENLPPQRVGADCRDAGCDFAEARARRRKHREYQFGDCIHDRSAIQLLSLEMMRTCEGGEAAQSQHRNAINAAKAVGARRVLYSSHMG